MAKDRKDVFGSWTKKLTMSVEELEKEFQERLVEVKKKYTKLSAEETDELLLAQMYGEFKEQFASKAKKFQGIFIGYTGIKDADDWTRKEVNKTIEKLGKEMATKLGYFNQKGEILFNDGAYLNEETGEVAYTKESEKYKWRRKDVIPNYSPQRRLYGLCREQEGESKTLIQFVMYDKQVKSTPPFYKPVGFRANSKSKPEDGVYQLNAAGVTNYKIVKDEEIDFVEYSKKYFRDNCVSLQNLYNGQEVWKPSGDAKISQFVITRGEVPKIVITEGTKPDGSEKNNVIELSEMTGDMSLDADSKNVAGFVNKEVPIKFAEGGVAYVVGSPFLSKEGDRMMNVFGIYPDPKYSIILPDPEPPITKENGNSKTETLEAESDENWA